MQLLNDVVCPQQISLPPTRVAFSIVKVELKSVVGPVRSTLVSTTCSPSGRVLRIVVPPLSILKKGVPSLYQDSEPNSVALQVKMSGTSGQTGTLVSGLDSSRTCGTGGR